MSNVERLRVEQDAVHLLFNKFQRHRGDTLNSRACFKNLKYLSIRFKNNQLIDHSSYHLSSGDFSAGGNYRGEASALVSSNFSTN